MRVKSIVGKLARFVDKEEKIGVKLIVSAHVLERISQVANTGEKTEIDADATRSHG